MLGFDAAAILFLILFPAGGCFLGAVILRSAAWLVVRKLDVPFWRAVAIVVLSGALSVVLGMIMAIQIIGLLFDGSEAQAVFYLIVFIFISLFFIHGLSFGYIIRMPIYADGLTGQAADLPEMILPEQPDPQAGALNLPPPMINIQNEKPATVPVQYQPIGYGRGVLVALTYFGIWFGVGAILTGCISFASRI